MRFEIVRIVFDDGEVVDFGSPVSVDADCLDSFVTAVIIENYFSKED